MKKLCQILKGNRGSIGGPYLQEIVPSTVTNNLKEKFENINCIKQRTRDRLVTDTLCILLKGFDIPMHN